MKICMIVPDPMVKGGIAAVVNGYRGSTLEKKNEVTYIESYRDGSKWQKLWKALCAYAAFRKAVKRERPDVVHIHSSFGPSFYRKLPFILWSAHRGIPVVNHIHGAEFDTFYENASAGKKKLVGKIYNRCTRLIVLSQEWKNRIGKIVPPEKIDVIENYCKIPEMPDTEYISDRFAMPVFGVKTDRECFAVIVTGMAYNYKLISGVKNGRYYIYPRFLINGEELYENISVAYHYLSGEDADYSGMARCYRNYQLKRGECLPLAERAAVRPELEYARDSVMRRLRQGWKPCAPEVLEQTPETEPPMYSACDFDRVSEIVDELKKQGIDKAEICLVGWNTKGHDGRWPQCFPVSEELGGEQKLRALIKKACDMGYQITCHTNSTDTYRISELWNEDDLITESDGSYPKDAPWSGGQMYQICPEIALKQAKEILPQVAGLGFHGIHYIDVLNIVMPRTCHNKKHPLNMGESIKKNREIMKLAQELFGGYSSEGGYDFGAKYLDFALNLNYYGNTCPNPMCDEKIPFWQLVYHGIILSNPDMCECMNFSCRKENVHARLKLIEYGGRPTFYYYSVFRDNWRDNRDEDLICDDRAQLEKSVAQIKEGY